MSSKQQKEQEQEQQHSQGPFRVNSASTLAQAVPFRRTGAAPGVVYTRVKKKKKKRSGSPGLKLLSLGRVKKERGIARFSDEGRVGPCTLYRVIVAARIPVLMPTSQSLSLSFFFSLSLYFFLSLSLSLSLSLFFSISFSLFFSLSFSPSLSFYFSLPLSISLYFSISIFLSFSLSFSISLCFSISIFLSFSLSLFLSSFLLLVNP